MRNREGKMEAVAGHACAGRLVNSGQSICQDMGDPGVCPASGRNERSTSFIANYRATIAIVESGTLIFINNVRAVTLSPRTFKMIRCCCQWADHNSMATSTANASQSCCPSAMPMGVLYESTSSWVSGDAK